MISLWNRWRTSSVPDVVLWVYKLHRRACYLILTMLWCHSLRQKNGNLGGNDVHCSSEASELCREWWLHIRKTDMELSRRRDEYDICIMTYPFWEPWMLFVHNLNLSRKCFIILREYGIELWIEYESKLIWKLKVLGLFMYCSWCIFWEYALDIFYSHAKDPNNWFSSFTTNAENIIIINLEASSVRPANSKS